MAITTLPNVPVIKYEDLADCGNGEYSIFASDLAVPPGKWPTTIRVELPANLPPSQRSRWNKEVTLWLNNKLYDNDGELQGMVYFGGQTTITVFND